MFKKIVGYGSLILGSLLLSFLLAELLIFRVIFFAPDVPTLRFEHGVIKYAPHQEGTFRIRDEVSGHFRINGDGWNSTHYRYLSFNERSGRSLIAVIGDSYIESFQVDVEKSYGEIVEASLKVPLVYRFGISGAPLSQYLQMLRNEVLPLRPTLIIINLVHNDFTESFKFTPGVYTSSFLKIRLTPGGITEIPPTPYVHPWYEPIRETATFRALVYRYGVRGELLRDLILGKKESSQNIQANIDAHEVGLEQENIDRVTRYLFQQVKRAADSIGAKVLIVMDGDRARIYRGESSFDSAKGEDVLSLNALSEKLSREMHFSFIDLHPIFVADYRAHQKRFNSYVDGHWNEYGHEVVARALIAKLQEESGMLPN